MCRIIDHEPIEDIGADEAYIPEKVVNLADKQSPWTIFSTTPTPLPNYEKSLSDLPWIILGFTDFSSVSIAFPAHRFAWKERQKNPIS